MTFTAIHQLLFRCRILNYTPIPINIVTIIIIIIIFYFFFFLFFFFFIIIIIIIIFFLCPWYLIPKGLRNYVCLI